MPWFDIYSCRGTSVTVPRRKGPVTGPQPHLPVRLGFPFWPSAAGRGEDAATKGALSLFRLVLYRGWSPMITMTVPTRSAVLQAERPGAGRPHQPPSASPARAAPASSAGRPRR
jgi:hypothetical protein